MANIYLVSGFILAILILGIIVIRFLRTRDSGDEEGGGGIFGFMMNCGKKAVSIKKVLREDC